MNAQQWRKKGCLAVFSRGLVILRDNGGQHYQAPVNRGGWMNKESLADFEKFEPTEKDRKSLDEIKAACYCSSLSNGNCDFCSGVRKP